MNSIKWPRSPWVLVAQWIERPRGAREIMGSILVGDSDFLFVPRSCPVDYFIFITFITELKIDTGTYECQANRSGQFVWYFFMKNALKKQYNNGNNLGKALGMKLPCKLNFFIRERDRFSSSGSKAFEANRAIPLYTSIWQNSLTIPRYLVIHPGCKGALYYPRIQPSPGQHSSTTPATCVQNFGSYSIAFITCNNLDTTVISLCLQYAIVKQSQPSTQSATQNSVSVG